MNIFEIDRAILDLVDPETGEIMDYDAFEQLQMERDQKLENVACWIKDLKAQANAIREEEQNLFERRKSIEKKAERLKTYLEIALKGESFSSPKCAVSFRRSASVEIEDQDMLIAWAERNGIDSMLKKTITVNKKEVANFMKTGIAVPGASARENWNIQIK